MNPTSSPATGTLIVLSGLPGSGKTTLAREVARSIGATYLRIDTIEDGLRNSFLQIDPAEDAGYVVAYALARDNLELGRTVIADSVNGIRLTQEAWRHVAKAASAQFIQIEIQCSNTSEHKRRIEARSATDGTNASSDWKRVVERNFSPADDKVHVIDTADQSVEQSTSVFLKIIGSA